MRTLRELTLADDFMFGEVMQQKRICIPFLTALLQKDIQDIEYIQRQSTLTDTWDYHGVRLDILAKDKNGAIYNIEMQTTNQRDLERRARFYQASIDRASLPKSKKYTDVADSYIIFICTFDYYKAGEAVYEKICTIKGHPELSYDDGSHVYILNSKYKKEKEGNLVGELKDFLSCVNGDEYGFATKYGKEVSGAVTDVRNDEIKSLQYLKTEEKKGDLRAEGRAEGEKIGLEKGLAQGRAEGRAEGIAELIAKLRANGMTEEQIQNLLR